MLGQRHMHLEVEMLKWLAVFALAGAVALALVSRAYGGEVVQQPQVPGLLPPDMERLAEPMDEVTLPTLPDAGVVGLGERGLDEKGVAEGGLMEEGPDDAHWPKSSARGDILSERNAQLWAVLEFHRQGQVEQALEAWADIALPCESEAWRAIAMSAAYLSCGQLNDAVATLDTAERLDPDNPVLNYYLGVLRMQQAAAAPAWYDATGETPTRLVAWVPRQVTPNNKSMYELAAMTSLQRAIDMSSYLEQNRLLIGSESDAYQESSMSQMPPMVYDLLVAIGADNFEGKAHNLLSYLCLDRGWLEEAERHMDEAAETGLPILYGYSDLGNRYELAGRNLDASRSYLKQLGHGGSVIEPAGKVYSNLRKALIDMF